MHDKVAGIPACVVRRPVWIAALASDVTVVMATVTNEANKQLAMATDLVHLTHRENKKINFQTKQFKIGELGKK